MKVSENTSVQLDLKTIIAIISITASFVGMYYTLQEDIAEAKTLPPTEVTRLEYELELQRQLEELENKKPNTRVIVKEVKVDKKGRKL